MLENEGATPEVPNEVEQAEPVEKSMDDTIRETLRGLREKGVEPEAEAKPVESDEEKAQRLRDEQGRFKAAEQAPEAAPEAAPEVPETPASPAPKPCSPPASGSSPRRASPRSGISRASASRLPPPPRWPSRLRP